MLVCDAWSSPPVRVALTPRRRLRGLRAVPPGTGLLLRTRSVHGRGMAAAVGLARLDPEGTVVATAVLSPGGVRRLPGRGWILELPAGWPPPPVGARVEARPIFAGCPAV